MTGIKICGITRLEDAIIATEAGADALGFVFYPKSKRCVEPALVREIVLALPPFVNAVGLFVNADVETIESVLSIAPLSLLQFHGDEPPTDCERHRRPYIKAIRMKSGVDLEAEARRYGSARALLLDTDSLQFGGTGHAFDWSMIPEDCSKPLILAGGLNPDNVAEAIDRVRPAVVDVSSGVERQPGLKCADKIKTFVAAVRRKECTDK